jgi:tagaturonate reductase
VAQDNLYTLCTKGLDSEGNIVNTKQIITSINQILIAAEQWQEIEAIAVSDSLTTVISNTTEIGIVYKKQSFETKPTTFPARLTLLLYKRFLQFYGNSEKGLVIVPTELIVNNGQILKEIVLQHSADNCLGNDFINWINQACTFCNSLVDRIVPGKASGKLAEALQNEMNYEDNLAIVAEPYHLWAIQGNEKVKQVLSFHAIDEQIKIEENIDSYCELKLRLLNGTHSFCCALAMLCNFETVSEAMRNATF